jgi:hypothetical protein
MNSLPALEELSLHPGHLRAFCPPPLWAMAQGAKLSAEIAGGRSLPGLVAEPAAKGGAWLSLPLPESGWGAGAWVLLFQANGTPFAQASLQIGASAEDLAPALALLRAEVEQIKSLLRGLLRQK